jgi:hypothetical protein
MSFICNPSQSPTFSLLLIPVGNSIASGLKSLNDGPNITIIVAPKMDVVFVDQFMVVLLVPPMYPPHEPPS